MKTVIYKVRLIGFMALLGNLGHSQGFVNLDFEDADLTGYPPESSVPAMSAFPRWAVTAAYTPYNTVSLSGNAISIMDANSSYLGYNIQGNYYALLVAGNSPSSSQTISIGQIGTIPEGTQSITFWGNIGGLQVTFDGHPLYFNIIGTGPQYNIYGADISEYRGQTGNLLFTLPPYVASAALDNIQFSSSSIPEPSMLSLVGLGLLGLGWHRRRI
jgi:hypothetical protein